MSRPDVPAEVAALEFVGFAESEAFWVHEGTIQGPPLDADVRVLVSPSLDPMHAAEILEEAARRLRQRGTVAEPPTLREVRLMLCRIGGAS
jgi:hypothetical protein